MRDTELNKLGVLLGSFIHNNKKSENLYSFNSVSLCVELVLVN